jgi:hypothetical protein
VLTAIWEGYTAMPPDISFVYNQLDKDGNLKIDNDGLELFNHTFGTNSEECYHKHLKGVVQLYNIGCEMVTYIINEHRHRYTHNVSEQRRHCFPTIGNYDTWLLDALQDLVEDNRGIIICPGWTNSSDYIPTAETFGTGPIQHDDLTEAVNNIRLSKMVNMTPEQHFIAKMMGVNIPFIYKFTHVKKQLMAKLVLNGQDTNDVDSFVMEWVKRVNGTDEAWNVKRRIKDSAKKTRR